MADDTLGPASGWRGLLRRAQVDRAVTFGVLASVFQLLSAPITLFAIARYATPEMQGYYYTFASLLALQSYLELGLSVVVSNTASHEWAHLRLSPQGAPVGDANALSRLVSLGSFVFKWYAIAAVLFVMGVGTAGYIFFSRSPPTQVDWQGPWFALVALTGVLLWALPFNSILEGCNQVATVQRFRFGQLVLRNVALWVTFALGGGLWAVVAATLVAVLRDIYFLGVQYRAFFKPFLAAPAHARIDWKLEIWPMQWRLALSGMVGFFLFQLFNPVMFHYHGAVVAGQMGITLALATAVQTLATQWLWPRAPRFGMLIARKEYADLDHLWLRTLRSVVLVALAGAGSAWLCILALHVLQVPIHERFLPPLPTALLLAGSVFLAAAFCETVYLRAHKREPIMVMSVVTSLLMGGLVWWLGSRYGAVGAAAAYVVVFGLVVLPWETSIFLRCRKTWHAA